MPTTTITEGNAEMTRSATCLAAALSVALFCGADWLQFRGTNGASLSPDAAPPDSWSETSNVAWKASLPGRGASGPIVVKGRTYVTCSSGVKQDRLHVVCFDNESNIINVPGCIAQDDAVPDWRVKCPSHRVVEIKQYDIREESRSDKSLRQRQCVVVWNA